MSEAPGNHQLPEQEPKPRWSTSNIILVIIAGILVLIVLACGIGGYLAKRTGEPVKATAFIDNNTTGIAMFRSDMQDPEYRQLLSVVGASAIKYNLAPKYNDLFKFFKENKQEEVPSSSIVGSYQNAAPSDLQRFVAVSFRQLPKFYRWQAGSAFENVANQNNAVQYDDARIMPAEQFFESVKKGNSQQDNEAVPPPKVLKNKQIALYDDCLFVGRTVESVEAGLKAYTTKQPEGGTTTAFMDLFRHVDTKALLFGAGSNENGILLAALFPDEAKREDVRKQIQSMLLFEPDQIQNIAMSVDLGTVGDQKEQQAAVSDAKLKGIIKLWVDAASPEAAQQVKTTIESLVRSQEQTTQKLPLKFSIVENESSINDDVYQAVVEVTGIEDYVDQLIAKEAKRRQAEKPQAPESETPPGPQAPDQSQDNQQPVKVSQ